MVDFQKSVAKERLAAREQPARMNAAFNYVLNRPVSRIRLYTSHDEREFAIRHTPVIMRLRRAAERKKSCVSERDKPVATTTP